MLLTVRRVDQSHINFTHSMLTPHAEHKPLAGIRGSYVDILSNFPASSDPTWAGANREELFLASAAAKSAQINSEKSTLAHLLSTWKTYKPDSVPALVATVMKKSQVLCIGHIAERQKQPFQAYLELADGTATVSAVLWYGACQTFYNAIQVGDTITVSGYRIKAATFFSKEFSASSIELSLNSRNPEAEVGIIRPADLLPNSTLPKRRDTYHLNTCHALQTTVDDTVTDIAGVITFIGRVEREPAYSSSNKHFWSFRWLEITDATSRTVPVKLYSCGQQDEFASLRLGMLIVCTNVRVGSAVVGAALKRYVFATTTKSSQYAAWFHDPEATLDDSPFAHVKFIEDLYAWVPTFIQSKQLTQFAIGGYKSLPIAPSAKLTVADLAPAIQSPVVAAEITLQAAALGIHTTRTVSVQVLVAEALFLVDPQMNPSAYKVLPLKYASNTFDSAND